MKAHSFIDRHVGTFKRYYHIKLRKFPVALSRRIRRKGWFCISYKTLLAKNLNDAFEFAKDACIQNVAGHFSGHAVDICSPETYDGCYSCSDE